MINVEHTTAFCLGHLSTLATNLNGIIETFITQLNGIDLSDAKFGSIVTIDMDGMNGAESGLLLKCEVIGPKLLLCKAGVALISDLI